MTFDEIFSLTSQHMRNFSESVQDKVGQSIVSDVFEPILLEIAHLQQLNELYYSTVHEVDMMLNEIRSIGNSAHE